MRSPIAPRTASGFIPVARGLLTASLLTLMLVGCKALEEPGAHVAGLTLVDPTQRHPIMVSQQPATVNVRVAPRLARAHPRPAGKRRRLSRALSGHGRRQQQAGDRRAERLAQRERSDAARLPTCGG